ncbi:MAG: response regulator [Pseudomonadales bacterium]|nr:response regulator [Pseudomonadales bacterium]
MPVTPINKVHVAGRIISRSAIYSAIIACASVLVGTILIQSVQTLTALFLVCFLVLCCLLLTFERNRLLQVKEDLKYKDFLLDAITDVYWEWNLQSGAFNYNTRLTEILEYDPKVNKDAKFWKEKIHPIDRPQQKYQLFRHIADESIPYYSEYRILNAAGVYKWFAGSGKVVLKDNGGKATLMCGRLDCIQERKDLEQSLIHAHKMEALGQLTGGIAHDFNNILASILGYTELALDSNHDRSMGRYLEQIQLAGRRAKNVLRQLLDFSRHSKAETKLVCLQTEIHETIKMLHSTFPSTVEINEQFPQGDFFSRLDPNQLQRVLLNLCINARDAMSGKGILNLWLESQTVHQKRCASCHGIIEGDFHILHIDDNGEGINPRILDKLFEPFFTTKEFGEGTGMGLAVVHGVVHDYNGHINLTSKLGHGTNICLYFPATQTKHTEYKPEQLLLVDKIQLDKNILVIEDDKFVSRFLLDLLACYGCDVEVAENSAEAIHAISRSKKEYDIVLSDQTMPGITGTELASKLYTLKPNLPIILYSGSHLDLALCPDNVQEVLQKPINNKKLIEVISRSSVSNG